MNIAELMNSACDKTKAPAYHNEFWTITQAELERFTALVLAAHTAKLLAGVELPEPLAYEVHRAMCEPYLNYTKVKGALGNTPLFTKDQLQAYAAQARLNALDEAKQACLQKHANGNWKHDTREECADAIEEMKGKS